MGENQGQGGIVHRQDVLTLLNRDLANEMNTMLMYMADSLLVRGPNSFEVKTVAEQFARQDFEHVGRLAARIVELEGSPQLLPTQVTNNASIEAKAVHDGSTKDMLTDVLENEMQSVIEYKRQIQGIGFNDPATRLLLEEILAEKETQAEGVRNLLGI